MILTLMTIFTFIHVKAIMKIKLVELAFLCQLFLYACIIQYGLYVYINYIDLYDLYKHITECEELKQCLRHIKTGTAKIFFLLFPAHIVIAHTPAGKADLQAGAAQPCL